MTNTAWMRFQQIMHDGRFILPVAPLRFARIDANNIEIRTTHRVYSYEVTDFAAEKTGFDGWMIKVESPTKSGQEYVWKLTKG